MSQFYRLMGVVLLSGTIAGLVLFAVQHVAVVPLIESAEGFETQEDTQWRPAAGRERVSFTALTTVLSAVGFAAVLFGFLALFGVYPNTRQGLLWGVAAFVCIHLAPALGLPPEPPGVISADVQERQLWWSGTVVATAIGLWLMATPTHSWKKRILGAICLAIPHVIGAPAVTGPSAVPPALIQRFTIASLATSALFWPLLGAVGGRLNGVKEDGNYKNPV